MAKLAIAGQKVDCIAFAVGIDWSIGGAAVAAAETDCFAKVKFVLKTG